MKIFDEKDFWESYKKAVLNRQKKNFYEKGNLILPSSLENIEFVSQVINLLFRNRYKVELEINGDMTVEEFFNKVYPYLKDLYETGYWRDFYNTWVWIAKWITLKNKDPKEYLKIIRGW